MRSYTCAWHRIEKQRTTLLTFNVNRLIHFYDDRNERSNTNVLPTTTLDHDNLQHFVRNLRTVSGHKRPHVSVCFCFFLFFSLFGILWICKNQKRRLSEIGFLSLRVSYGYFYDPLFTTFVSIQATSAAVIDFLLHQMQQQTNSTTKQTKIPIGMKQNDRYCGFSVYVSPHYPSMPAGYATKS